MINVDEIEIPADYPVQPQKPIHCERAVTCGTCGLTWDDAIVTSMTPAPAARCPFEPFHLDESDDFNATAEFLPMDPEDEGTLPCVVVAGVQVYVYVEDGKLVISADFDTSELGDRTPVTVKMSGETVWEA